MISQQRLIDILKVIRKDVDGDDGDFFQRIMRVTAMAILLAKHCQR